MSHFESDLVVPLMFYILIDVTVAAVVFRTAVLFGTWQQISIP